MYPFMTLGDDAETVRSEMDGRGWLRAYSGKPDAHDGSHCAACWLLDGTRQSDEGFSEEELAYF